MKPSLLSLVLPLAASALVQVSANAADWSYPEGATSKDAAVLTAAPDTCLAEISKHVLDLERKLQASEVDSKWFTTSPYVTGQTGDRKFAFHLSYDEGQHAAFLKVNGRLKAIEEACAGSTTPQAAGVAEYRRTLNFYLKVERPAALKDGSN